MDNKIVPVCCFSEKERLDRRGWFKRGVYNSCRLPSCSWSVALKVPMKWKIIAAYLKAFKKYSRMAFSSLADICFRSKYINVSVLCKLGKWWRSKLWNGNIEILKSSNLVPEVYITKEIKWILWCSCQGNPFGSSLILSKSKYPDFHPF